MGLVSLYIGWTVSDTHSRIGGILGVLFGVVAVYLKISSAKKGNKHVLATIGSYSGVLGTIMSLIQVIL